jgi:hypothetical protein
LWKGTFSSSFTTSFIRPRKPLTFLSPQPPKAQLEFTTSTSLFISVTDPQLWISNSTGESGSGSDSVMLSLSFISTASIYGIQAHFSTFRTPILLPLQFHGLLCPGWSVSTKKVIHFYYTHLLLMLSC